MMHRPSLKWNASANFVGLGYTTVIGVVVMPLYLQYLGEEAFGLIGFFLVMQGVLQIFDMGISPLLSRQTAQTRGENTGYLELRELLRSLELLILIAVVATFSSITFASPWIATKWLGVSGLAPDKVTTCIVLMGSIIAPRFFATLYRSGIQGMEEQVLLNITNVVVVTLRFIGALLLVRFVTQDIVHFFIYQLLIGVFESVVLAHVFYRLSPVSRKIGVAISWRSLIPVAPFAGGIAYSAIIWVLLSQLDKLVLSNVLTLSDYGYFTLAAIISAGISQVGAPISQAILPRMTYLLSQGHEDQMLLLYRQSTQLMAAVVLPLAGVIAFYATEILFAWTGNATAADWAGPVLFWFALGNGILAISAFQFYLQFAHGNLRMHVIFNSIVAGLQIPVIIYVAYEFGVMGVALAWFLLRLLSFLIWTPIVHKKFAHGIHLSWLVTDIGPSFVVTCSLLLGFKGLEVAFDDMSRALIFVTLVALGGVMVACNLLVSRAPRNLLRSAAMKAFTHED